MKMSDQIGSEGEVFTNQITEPEDRCEKSIGSKIADVLARVVSVVMIPFLMPLYVVGFALWGNTILSLLKPALKWHIAGVISLITILIPMFVVWVLYAFKFISDPGLNNRRDRIVPIMATIVCYLACLHFLSGITGAFLVRQMLVAGVACLGVSFVVTFFWKISLHMVGAGALVAMLLSINMMSLGDMLYSIMAMILLSGILASARLYLRRHTPMQVLCGFLLGFGCAFAVMIYFF